MKRQLALSSLFLSTFLSTSVFALPESFAATYAVKKAGIKLGEMQAQLQQENNHYRYSKLTKTQGVAALFSKDQLFEESDGIIIDNKIETKHYRKQHTGKKKSRKEEFKRLKNGVIKGDFDGKPYRLESPHNMIDLTALELQLSEDVKNKKYGLQYHIADRGKLKLYQTEHLGKETVNVPAGAFECEKIKVSNKSKHRYTVLWLSAEMEYMPVKIIHFDDGDKFVATLTSHNTEKSMQ